MKNVKIPRLVKEGSVNPEAGIPYNIKQLNIELEKYIKEKFGYISRHKNIIKANGELNVNQFYTIDIKLLVGRMVGYDKDNIYVDFKSKECYDEFLKYKNPKALMSMLVEYNNKTNEYDISNLVKIEIGDVNKKGEVING